MILEISITFLVIILLALQVIKDRREYNRHTWKQKK